MTDTTYDPKPGPACYSVFGVTKTHAKRAITYMRRRNMLALYRPDDKSLNTWLLKSGRDATYKALETAIEATRK